MSRLGALDWVALVLVIIGGLNWGLVGAFNFDLVAILPSVLPKIIYIVVGLSAIYAIFTVARVSKAGSMTM